MANGIALMSGCEMTVRRWVRDPSYAIGHRRRATLKERPFMAEPTPEVADAKSGQDRPDATEIPKGMKRPKWAALTMQQQHDAGMNPFALQLIAEAHADDKSRFGDETVAAVAHAHDGTPVFILISTRQPTKEQFEGWPT